MVGTSLRQEEYRIVGWRGFEDIPDSHVFVNERPAIVQFILNLLGYVIAILSVAVGVYAFFYIFRGAGAI